jgi:hypothetical protein
MAITIGGLLVIERFSLSKMEEANWTTSSGLQMRDVLKRYKGFDGTTPWPEPNGPHGIRLAEGLASIDQFQTVWEYVQEVQAHSWCDLLYLQYVKISQGEFSHPDLHFCGYDFGHYGGLGNFFSVLLHEVINGRYDHLRQYTRTLNEYFLLPSLVEADGLKETRDALKLEGAILETEDDDEFGPIGIFALKSLS